MRGRVEISIATSCKKACARKGMSSARSSVFGAAFVAHRSACECLARVAHGAHTCLVLKREALRRRRPDPAQFLEAWLCRAMPLLSDCDTVAPGLGQGEGPELTLFAGRSAAMWRARLACVSARGVAKACQGVRFHNQVWSRALVSNEHPWHRLANARSV